MNRGVSIPLRNTQFDRIRGVSCAVNRPRRRAYPKIGTFPQSLHKRNPLLCAGGGFPGRVAQGLSLLLYSPGSHGGHIKWPPARAELATDKIPKPSERRIHGRGARAVNFSSWRPILCSMSTYLHHRLIKKGYRLFRYPFLCVSMWLQLFRWFIGRRLL